MNGNSLNKEALNLTFESLRKREKELARDFPLDVVPIEYGIQMWLDGQNDIIPLEWTSIYDQACKELLSKTDPEYSEYERLKAKFEPRI